MPTRKIPGGRKRSEQMKADKIVKATVKKIRKSVKTELSEKDLEKIGIILSDMAVELVTHATERCTKKVMKNYAPKTDLAHEISDDIRRAQTALVANLQSMR
jgi:ribosomal protein S13